MKSIEELKKELELKRGKEIVVEAKSCFPHKKEVFLGIDDSNNLYVQEGQHYLSRTEVPDYQLGERECPGALIYVSHVRIWGDGSYSVAPLETPYPHTFLVRIIRDNYLLHEEEMEIGDEKSFWYLPGANITLLNKKGEINVAFGDYKSQEEKLVDSLLNQPEGEADRAIAALSKLV